MYSFNSRGCLAEEAEAICP
jgi:hypothetical protein